MLSLSVICPWQFYTSKRLFLLLKWNENVSIQTSQACVFTHMHTPWTVEVCHSTQWTKEPCNILHLFFPVWTIVSLHPPWAQLLNEEASCGNADYYLHHQPSLWILLPLSIWKEIISCSENHTMWKCKIHERHKTVRGKDRSKGWAKLGKVKDHDGLSSPQHSEFILFPCK